MASTGVRRPYDKSAQYLRQIAVKSGGMKRSDSPGNRFRASFASLTGLNPSVAFSGSSPFKGALIAPTVPPLKGEVPAAQAVGFIYEEISRSNLWLWRLISRSIRR